MSLAFLSSDVFSNAVAVGTVAAVVSSLVGYFIVLRAQAFAAESFIDICFAGATGASLLGVAPLAGMAVFGLGAALGMGFLGEKARERSVEIGMVVSFALGLGVLFLGIYARGSAAHANAGIAFLFGSLLSVQTADIFRMLAIAVVVLAALAIVFRPLLFITADAEAAAARGVPVRVVSTVFLLIVALAAAAGAMAVGILLAASLLIAPAAAAARLARRPATALLLSVCMGLGVTWGGILLAFLGSRWRLPVGFTVSALAAVLYFAAAVTRRKGYAGGGGRIIIGDSAETGQWISKKESPKLFRGSAKEPRSRAGKSPET